MDNVKTNGVYCYVQWALSLDGISIIWYFQ